MDLVMFFAEGKPVCSFLQYGKIKFISVKVKMGR
jgi:translation initiation factor IF-3